jgi:outer membrane OprD family porin
MAGLTKGRAACATLGLACAMSAAQPSRTLADVSIDYPIPSEAKEAFSPIGEGFDSPIDPRGNLKGPKSYVDPDDDARDAARRARWPGAPAFFRDTTLKANSRTYFFDEHSFGVESPEALTTGGWLSYESGYIADFFQLRGALYTTQPLYADEDASVSLNVSPDNDQITTLGQLHGRAEFAGQALTAGRHLVRTPYINAYDDRMIPLTFEGVTLLPESTEDRKLDYIASYLWRYKPRNTSKFVPFSQGLGVDEVNEGVLITGASYHDASWNIGFANYWIKDTLNTAYGEIDYMLPFGGGEGQPSFRIGVNTLDQRSVGADFIPGAPYQTYQASARFIASYRNFVFTGAVSQTGDEADIQKPFGYSASYSAMIVTNFDQAGVRAYLLSLSYDFEKLGLEGVKFHAAWGKGTGVPDLATNGGYANQDEFDLRLSYEPLRGRLRGLRVDIEYIDWQVFDLDFPSDDLTQFRAIVNYAVPLM